MQNQASFVQVNHTCSYPRSVTSTIGLIKDEKMSEMRAISFEMKHVIFKWWVQIQRTSILAFMVLCICNKHQRYLYFIPLVLKNIVFIYVSNILCVYLISNLVLVFESNFYLLCLPEDLVIVQKPVTKFIIAFIFFHVEMKIICVQL